MSVRKSYLQACWLLLTLALSFALAGCASSKGATSAPKPGSSASKESSKREEAAGASTKAEGRSGESSREAMAERKPLSGEHIEIRKPWVQVRSKPSEQSAAIALAFGNDTLPVVEKQGDWVRVRLDKNRDGWVPVSATEP
jgi:uncharacterized protein YgiM (DUF1202 family)